MTQPAIDVRDRLPIELAGRRWAIELRKLRRRPVPTFRSGFDNGQEPGEQSLSNESVWRRTGRDWVLGAGQTHYDETDESSRRRFRWSKGIDCWDRRELKLLPDTTLLAASADTTQRLAATDDRLWWSTGNDLLYATDPTDNWTTVTGLSGGPITSLAYTGDHLYVANGGTLSRVALNGNTATSFGSTTPDLVAYASGRLLAADGNQLFEIDSNGAAIPIWDYPSASFTWDWILGTLNGIYVGGSAAGRSEVFLVSVVDATGELAAPYPVMPFVTDETIHTAAYYAGYIIFGTSRGIRMARIQANGFLAYGPLRELAPVKAVASRGEYVWFSWPDFDDGSTGLGRLSLARFTEEMVPAYASDLMYTGQGAVESIVSFDGSRYFTVAGEGLVGQTNNLVAEGQWASGNITYGTPERKAFVSIEGRWAAIPTGASLDIEFVADDGTKHGGILNAGPFQGLGAIQQFQDSNLAARETEGGEIWVTLRSDGADAGPVLNRWTLRAIPMPFQAEEIFLPLQLFERVTHGGVTIHQPTLEDYEFVVNLRDSRRLVPLKIGAEELLVYVNSVLVDQDELTQWTRDETFIEGVYYATCISIGAEG